MSWKKGINGNPKEGIHGNLWKKTFGDYRKMIVTPIIEFAGKWRHHGRERKAVKILALDTGTKTGWCFWENGKVTESGVQDFSKRRGESNGLMFLRFRKWLYSLCDAVQPELIAYEMAHHRGGAATEIGVNLTGRVQEIAAAIGVEAAPVATGTLKKFATGKGNAEKNAMIEAARKILGREPLDDNEADAVHLAMFAEQEYAPPHTRANQRLVRLVAGVCCG